MPIYTAQQVNSGKPATVFAERQLSLVASRIEEVGIYAVPKRPAPSSYLTNLANIHQFGKAHIAKRIEVTNLGMFNVFKSLPSCHIGARPVLMINLPKLGDEEKNSYKELGITESTQGRNGMFIGQPTMEQFRTICRKTSGVLDHPTLPGNVSPVGYLAFDYAWKGVGLLAAGLIKFRQNIASNRQVLYGDLKTQELEEGKEHTDPQAGVYTVGEVTGTEKKLASIVILESRVVAVPFHGITPEHFTLDVTGSFVGDGHLFPYFSGLVMPSRELLGELFFRYCSRSISSTDKEFATLAPSLRRGFRNLASTAEGMALQHVYFCLDVAIQLGGYIVILVEGNIYMGSLVITDGQILNKATLVDPVENEELKREVMKLSRHTEGIMRIKVILDGCPKATGDLVSLDVETVRYHSRRLAEELFSRDLSTLSSEQRGELESAIDNLSFGEKYWEINSENVTRLVRALLTGKWSYPEAPYYIHGGIGLSLNPIIRALAAFGPQGPSIHALLGNTRIVVAKPGRDDQNLTEKDSEGKRKRLPYIPVYRMAITTAADSWKSVQTKGEIKFFGPRKNRKEFSDKSKEVAAITNPKFEDFYSVLREYVGAKDIPKETSKKRKVADMEIETPGASGSKKAKVDSSLLDMF